LVPTKGVYPGEEISHKIMHKKQKRHILKKSVVGTQCLGNGRLAVGCNPRSMRFFKAIALSIFACFFQTSNTIAQPWTLLGDTLHGSAYDNAVDLYTNAVGKASGIYSGSKHYDADYEKVRSTPFIGSEYWEYGDVVYDDRLYRDIELKYDGYKDALIIVYYGESGRMSELRLIDERVAGFSLLGTQYIRVEADTVPNPSIKGGFYALLHSGTKQLLAKRRVTRETYTSGSNHYDFFKPANRYYLCDPTVFVQVKNGRKLLKYLTGHEKELKSFRRKNRNYFNDDREGELIAIMQFYHSLYAQDKTDQP
jgi:hypothetical protein